MPLVTSKLTRKSTKAEVDRAISQDIEEMLSSYKKTGKIGNTTPRNLAHAQKIASAAAHENVRRRG